MTKLLQSRGGLIRRFRALPGWEQRWLIQTACWLPVVVMLVRLLGLRRCVTLAARISGLVGAEVWVGNVGRERVDRVDRVERVERVDRAAVLTAVGARHGLVRGTCLSRSLTLWWMLRSRGIQASLRIGVRKRQQRLEAHAWVEYQECVLGEGDEVRLHFVPIGTFGTFGAWGDQQMPSNVLTLGNRAL